MSWKTTKYEYNGISFMSQGEVKLYQELEKSGLDFEYQPEPIEILPKFKGASGKTYQAMNYEADFMIKVPHNLPIPHNHIKIYIEVKGQNDNIYTYRKGQPPQIKDQSELYRLRHKIFDKIISETGNLFLLVRDNQLKTPQWAGMFWEQDLQQLRKYKKQGKKELCEQVPRIMDRLKIIIKDINEN